MRCRFLANYCHISDPDPPKWAIRGRIWPGLEGENRGHLPRGYEFDMNHGTLNNYHPEQEIESTMATTWEEYRDALCQKLENDFQLPKFGNRDYPIKALTSNDRVTQDPEFRKHMKKNGQKDLAIIGDSVINLLIYEHFLKEDPPQDANHSSDFQNESENSG